MEVVMVEQMLVLWEHFAGTPLHPEAGTVHPLLMPNPQVTDPLDFSKMDLHHGQA
jgi:hypothetical protein